MNKLLLAGAALGIWALSRKKPETKVTKIDPNKEGQCGLYFYEYDCKTFEILNFEAWQKFHIDTVKQAFDQLKLPIEKILDFKNYVVKFCDNYMKIVQSGQCITCPVPKGDMEVAIRFVLCSEAIDDLGALALGSPADTLSPEYEKWTTNMPLYINALKASLGIKTEEQEKMLNEAYKVFQETYKLG